MTDMPTPDIVAIIPCYNGAEYLDGAIASVLEQSHAVSTVLVVDDASTDDSGAVAQAYAGRGYPVRCLRLARNSGPATARNAAIAQTSEPLVAFLDADDRWTRDHCESLLALLLAHPDADLAFSSTRASGAPNYASVLPFPTGQPVELIESLLDDSCIPQSGVLARRDSILADGGYTDGMRYSEDYDLWLRMAHGRRFIASGAPTCIRTLHPGQASRHEDRMYRGRWEARMRYADFARRVGNVVPPERFRSICARAYERDLADAWRSRSLPLLRSVLAHPDIVPGGHALSRRWALRAVAFWPLWRLAAACWDTLPDSWRSRVRTFRGRSSAVSATDAP